MWQFYPWYSLLSLPSRPAPTKLAARGADTTQHVEVIKLAICAKHIQQEFEEFITGLDPAAYMKSLMWSYFTDRHQQGQISVFTVPLDRLYKFRWQYEDVLARLLQVEGCIPWREAVEKAGKPIEVVIGHLEDIWCMAIDGAEALCCAYSNERLVWQHWCSYSIVFVVATGISFTSLNWADTSEHESDNRNIYWYT